MIDILYPYRLLSLVVRWSYSRMLMPFPWKHDIPFEDLVGRWTAECSTFINVKGLKVHVCDEGPREDTLPLVLIHGTSSSLQTWEGWITALKQRRRVISFDLPGFGLTGPNSRNDYRTKTYVRFMLDLLDILGIEQCVLCGNSLGGDIAWQTALAAPQRVQGLVLVDAAGYPLPSESRSIYYYVAKTPLLNQVLRFAMSRDLIESGLRKLYGDPSRVTRDVVDRHTQLMLREGNRQALIKAIEQSEVGTSSRRIKNVKQPTLIIWGGRDRLIPLEHAYQFHRDIAGSLLRIFGDLGHMPQEEDPARTVQAVLEFVDKRAMTRKKGIVTEARPGRLRFMRSVSATIAGWISRFRHH